MDQEIKAKWLEALRGGQFRQATGILRSRDDKYCCLGVLCQIVEPERWGQFPDGGWRHGEVRSGMPDIDVTEKAGINDHEEIGVLANMNDDGASFAVIADYIEKTL